ncbi:MAG: NADH-quinone oxidoreductase subunit L [Chitinophagaceae bacterium]|nr:NADH-quinone oxidoreductase subunit L [Chitinophagaceae bacterium]
MENYLYLIPALPLAGFLILSLLGKNLSKNLIPVIGAGSVIGSAIAVILLAIQYDPENPVRQILWQWFSSEDLSVAISLSVDALTIVFLFVITFVGALIHIYSAAFMREDRDYARFFASMNLFICSMLLLVMADNLVLLYLGWEGVGLCSYLLIGFWYEKPENSRAANKAFTITRIGDTAMLIGLFMLFQEFRTLYIPDILNNVSQHFESGSATLTTIALLLVGGAVGKSAQLPLQSWLPDAMAGPSPVSALIHAATMVTAGVYLIARMHGIFVLSPEAMAIVAIIGAITLIIAGCSALVQTDIKRILAYSTISQIGYMFLALGVGAWSAAIFHFFTHAFFKALLFLAAGAIIESLHHEHSIFKMGGLRKKMPLIFYTFLAGAASLAALPFITSGFFSKEQILGYSFGAVNGNPILWVVGITGAFITAIYTTRLMVVVFWGEEKTHVSHLPGPAMTLPLVVLAILSIAVGFIEWPHNLMHVAVFSDYVQNVLPATVERENIAPPLVLQGIAIFMTLFGIYVGYMNCYRKPIWKANNYQTPLFQSLRNFWFKGWLFDDLYNNVFVKPFLFITTVNRKDIIDKIYTGISNGASQLHRMFSVSQNGSLRWYIGGVLAGILIIVTIQMIV